MKISVKLNSQVSRALHDAAAAALDDILEDALAETIDVTPIEESTLIRSGFTELDRKTLTGQVAFDTPYAVRQHEDPTLRHDAGRKDHFLEDTVRESWPRHQKYLADKIREA